MGQPENIDPKTSGRHFKPNFDNLEPAAVTQGVGSHDRTSRTSAITVFRLGFSGNAGARSGLDHNAGRETSDEKLPAQGRSIPIHRLACRNARGIGEIAMAWCLPDGKTTQWKSRERAVSLPSIAESSPKRRAIRCVTPLSRWTSPATDNSLAPSNTAR